MATVEHCLYCFESLAADLEHREPMTLDQVQKSFAAYTAATAADNSSSIKQSAKKLPALRRLVGTGNGKTPDDSSSSLGSGSSSSTSLSSNTAATSISSSSTPPTAAAIVATPTGSQVEPVTNPNAKFPLFVTWDKYYGTNNGNNNNNEDDDDDYDDSDEWHLRGCIGTFHDGDPLSTTLAEYAITSALHDIRFPRVTLRELPSLRCTVNLLTNFEDCETIDDWEIGVHGIRIRFALDGRRYGSTYLPAVAEEQGWNRDETLVSLMRKAGWEGRRDSWRQAAERGGMRVERYRGDKEVVVYDEYKAWRTWVSEHEE